MGIGKPEKNPSKFLIIKTLLSFWAVLFLFHSSLFASQQIERKNILVLFSFRPTLPVATQWDQGIRSVFDAEQALNTIINIEYLDLTHFNDEKHVQLLTDLYRHKYSNKKPDLIIPVMNASVDLMLMHGEDLFPGVPIVFGGVEKQFIENRTLRPNITGHLTDIDYLTITGDSFATVTFLAGFGEVSPSEVPVPAAAWLFGSALVSLAGLGRKRR